MIDLIHVTALIGLFLYSVNHSSLWSYQTKLVLLYSAFFLIIYALQSVEINITQSDFLHLVLLACIFCACLSIYAKNGPRCVWLRWFIALQVIAITMNFVIAFSYLYSDSMNYNLDRVVYNVINYVLLVGDYFVLMGVVNGVKPDRTFFA